MKPSSAAAFLLAVIFVAVAGCVSTSTYQRGYAQKVTNSIEINKPRSEVWKTAVPALARQFFVINNIDQASGLINLSYGGDPERYVDCGQITIETQGRESLTFPLARAGQSYQAMTPQLIMVTVTRRMNLDGRVNLIFEEVPAGTRITSTIRYVLTREAESYQSGSGRVTAQQRHSISFNTNQSGNFPQSPGIPEGVECHPTGHLERDILEVIK